MVVLFGVLFSNVTLVKLSLCSDSLPSILKDFITYLTHVDLIDWVLTVYTVDE